MQSVSILVMDDKRPAAEMLPRLIPWLGYAQTALLAANTYAEGVSICGALSC